MNGTLLNCIWQCRKIELLWKEVRNEVEKIISKSIPMHPKFFILGLYPEEHNFIHRKMNNDRSFFLNAK